MEQIKFIFLIFISIYLQNTKGFTWISDNPLNSSTCEGRSIVMAWEYTGGTAVVIQWRKSNGTGFIEVGSYVGSLLTGEDGYINRLKLIGNAGLEINNTTSADNGTYHVVITTLTDPETSSATVNVYVNPNDSCIPRDESSGKNLKCSILDACPVQIDSKASWNVSGHKHDYEYMCTFDDSGKKYKCCAEGNAIDTCSSSKLCIEHTCPECANNSCIPRDESSGKNLNCSIPDACPVKNDSKASWNIGGQLYDYEYMCTSNDSGKIYQCCAEGNATHTCSSSKLCIEHTCPATTTTITTERKTTQTLVTTSTTEIKGKTTQTLVTTSTTEIKGKTTKTLVTTSENNGTDNQQFAVIIGVIVGVISFVIIIIVIYCCIRRRNKGRNSRKEQKENKFDPELDESNHNQDTNNHTKAKDGTLNPAYTASNASCTWDVIQASTSHESNDSFLERNEVTKSNPNKGTSNAQIQPSTHASYQTSISHQDWKDKSLSKENEFKETKYDKPETTSF